MTASIRLLAIVAAFVSLAWGQNGGSRNIPPSGGDSTAQTTPATKLPERAILVKGASSSASDSATFLPEDGSIANGIYTNPYLGLSYRVPEGWFQKSVGPPPSDSGRYVLTLLRPTDTFKGPGRGSILVTADDMFFMPLPVANALEFVNYETAHLQADYKLEQDPTETKIAGQAFTSFAYWSPATDLHWHVLATQIRCHTVEFFFMNRDPKALESLILEMNKASLSAEASPKEGPGGDAAPVCIKDYASRENVIERVDPHFIQHRYNPVPVRIIIGKDGKVKHIHFLSAFPDQAQAATDALAHWKFKPYLRDGKPVEVETGILFGRSPYLARPSNSAAVK